jgi:hypothetical protein
MKYRGYNVSGDKLPVSTNRVEVVKEWPVPKTQREVRSSALFFTFYVEFIHHFSALSAPLTSTLRRSQLQKIVMTPTCMEAFGTLKLYLTIPPPCHVLLEVSSDTTFTVTMYASAVGIAVVLVQDQGRGFQSISFWACKRKSDKRGNSYSAYDLEALVVFEAVKRWKCYLEGRSKFMVVSYHDTVRHLLQQPNDRLSKWHAR